MNENPRVSIIIPVYNGADFLSEAIDSAINQTYQNKEIIVVNDGSTDGGATEAIARSYGDRIRYFRKENGGVSTALNLGIRNMSGDYFSWLSHDDKYLRDKVKDSVEALRQNDFDEKLLAYTNSGYIDKSSEHLNRPCRERFVGGEIIGSVDCMRSMLKYGTLNGCALLVPKSAFSECGIFDEKLRYCQDTLMWQRIFGKGYKIVSDGKRNVLTRLHENQVSQTRNDLLASDSAAINGELLELFLAQEKAKELALMYCIRTAKNNLSSVTKQSIEYLRKNNILNAVDIFKIYIFICCGKVRKILKRAYYRVFLKVRAS